MHEALNIDKKIKLITQFSYKSRDESFKSTSSRVCQNSLDKYRDLVTC
jgi:hypothetical protein